MINEAVELQKKNIMMMKKKNKLGTLSSVVKNECKVAVETEEKSLDPERKTSVTSINAKKFYGECLDKNIQVCASVTL